MPKSKLFSAKNQGGMEGNTCKNSTRTTIIFLQFAFCDYGPWKERKKMENSNAVNHDFWEISCKVKTYHEFMSTVITAKEKSNANEHSSLCGTLGLHDANPWCIGELIKSPSSIASDAKILKADRDQLMQQRVKTLDLNPKFGPWWAQQN